MASHVRSVLWTLIRQSSATLIYCFNLLIINNDINYHLFFPTFTQEEGPPFVCSLKRDWSIVWILWINFVTCQSFSLFYATRLKNGTSIWKKYHIFMKKGSKSGLWNFLDPFWGITINTVLGSHDYSLEPKITKCGTSCISTLVWSPFCESTFKKKESWKKRRRKSLQDTSWTLLSVTV